MAERPAAPARAGSSRGLGPGLITFLVIDVVLVLAFFVLLAVHLSNSPDDRDVAAPSPSSTPQGPVEPEESPEQSAPPEPAESEALTEFVLPSGNITCSMTEDSATCSILSFTYEPPEQPADCDGTVGHTLTLTAGSAPTFVCDDEPPTAPPDDTPVLEYGSGSTIGEMTCLSSRNGVFCRHDPSGTGFSMARAGTMTF